MKTLLSLLVATAVTSAFGATDFERFDKLVGKYSVNLAGQDRPKGLCLCRDASLEGAVGFLLLGSTPPIGMTSLVASHLSCFVPGFNEDTGVRGSTFICSDFVPIAK